MVDTDGEDLVLTSPAATSHCLDLSQRIQQAALSPADSLDFLATVAEEQPDHASGDLLSAVRIRYRQSTADPPQLRHNGDAGTTARSGREA